MSDSAADRVMKARSSLILTQPFFGALGLRLKVVEDPSLKSGMVTNGKALTYNPKFIESLSDAEVKGLIAHEIMHCATGHPWRRDARDLKMFNEAGDYAINPILSDCGFTLPKGALNRADFKGKSAEEIYTVLLKERPPQGGKGKGKGKGKGQGQGQGGGGGQPGDGEGEGDEDDDQQPGGFDDGGAGDPAGAKEEESQWRVATAQAAAQAKLQGKLPGALERLIEENQRNKVDWKSVLRRFLTRLQKADYRWTKPHRRYMASGLYLPEFESEATMPPLVVVVDTSGSIGQAELNLFGAEINSIVKEVRPEKTIIVYCDSRVAHVDEFEPEQDIVLKGYGGGGTDMGAALKYINKNYADSDLAACIVLTDGYTPWGEQTEYPTLWAITTQGIEPGWGEHVFLGDDWVQK